MALAMPEIQAADHGYGDSPRAFSAASGSSETGNLEIRPIG
jgi:hypothetical protein